MGESRLGSAGLSRSLREAEERALQEEDRSIKGVEAKRLGTLARLGTIQNIIRFYRRKI